MDHNKPTPEDFKKAVEIMENAVPDPNDGEPWRETTDLQEYQMFVEDCRIVKGQNLVVYPVLGLAAEVGEVVEIVQKKVRYDEDDFTSLRNKFVDELGDVMWYLAAICNDLDITLDEVIEHNIQKLNARRYGNDKQASVKG